MSLGASTTGTARTIAAPRPRAPFALIIVATGLPMFMATLDNLVVTNALPAIAVDLRASMEQLQWVVNAYTLAFATFILFASGLGDWLGRRGVFVTGITIFTLASIAAALSTDPAQLIAARAVQGLGGAAVMPLSLSLLVGAVRPERRALAIGLWGGISGLGIAVGPLVGGSVMAGWDWQAIFWINVPVAVIAIPVVYAVLREERGAREGLDVPGVALSGIGVLALVYGIVRGNDAGWGSFEVLGSLSAGVALIAAFLWWETRTRAPLVPLRLYRDRSFSIAIIVGFALCFGMFGAVFILIQYLQIVQGHTPLEAAWLTSPWTLAPMVVAPLAGLVTPRIGTRALIVAGLSLQAFALVWLASFVTEDMPYGLMLPAFIAAGIGMGLTFAPSSTAVMANVAERDTAKASGTNSTVREIGVALGIAVLTAVFTGAGGELTPTGYVDAARPAILVGAAMLALGAVLGLLLPSGRSVRQRS